MGNVIFLLNRVTSKLFHFLRICGFLLTFSPCREIIRRKKLKTPGCCSDSQEAPCRCQPPDLLPRSSTSAGLYLLLGGIFEIQDSTQFPVILAGIQCMIGTKPMLKTTPDKAT